MIKEIKTLSNLYTFHIQKCTGRVSLDQSTSEAHAKLSAALEMWNRDRTVTKTGERKEGEEATAAATPAGTTGVVPLLGKGCFFFVATTLKPFHPGSDGCNVAMSGWRDPGLWRSTAACFVWRDSGEENTTGQINLKKP